mgnify:CR=1 FL=1|tara:strand:+ start:9075 stop:10760 length:1686 start_codon:yes stop_codon:yes gene_type:complete
MSIKDTFTSNSMNSFSFGGKTYTRRVDNGAVVYDISAGTDGSAFSTGWVNEDASGTPVENAATLTFNHNLGTTDFVASAMVADDASGSAARILGEFHEDDGSGGFSTGFGYEIKEITSTTITLQLGKNGYYQMDSAGINAANAAGGSPLSFNGQYVKVVLSAKMGSGGGGGTPVGSDGAVQLNANGVFGAIDDLKYDSGALVVPTLIVGTDNIASGDEGGEIALAGAPNATVAGYPRIDVFQDKIRFFEGGPPYKGAFIDLSECADAASGMTNLLAGGSGGGGGGSNWESVERVIDDTTTYTNTTGSTIVGISEIKWNQQDHVKLFVKITPAGGSEITIPVAQETNTGGGNLSVGSYFIPNGATYKFSANAGAGYSSPSVTDSNALFTVHNFYESTIGGGSGGSGGGGASVTTNTTAPNNPSDGDLWYDENSAALYVYTDSIGGWIQANGGGGGGGTGPRAYVEFDGTASNMTDELSASNSFNVSSITDNGAGDYTITFTSPVNNPIISLSNSVGGSAVGNESIMLKSNPTNASATIIISKDTTGASVSNRDSTYVSFIAH